MRVVLLALALVGCSEQNFSQQVIRSVATTTGDFDDVAAPLDRLLIAHTPYEGIISTATWDPTGDYDPEGHGLKVETLLGEEGELFEHEAVFIASGTRGLGKRVYNGLDADDAIVSDEAILDNVRDWVDAGGILIATDWSYDLVEAAWPDAIDFVGFARWRVWCRDGGGSGHWEDWYLVDSDPEPSSCPSTGGSIDKARTELVSAGDDYDAAQLGQIGTITADVGPSELRGALDTDVVALDFNFSNWAVMEGKQKGTTVWLKGDAPFGGGPNGGTLWQEDAPLLVSFSPAGGAGTVVYASFHVDAQNTAVVDTILETVVGDFQTLQPEADDIVQ